MTKEQEDKIREEIIQILAKTGMKALWTIEEILKLIKKYDCR